MTQTTIEQGNPLGYKPVGKLLMEFSIPAILGGIINSIYNIVDQIFIGQGVGYLGNAATTVTFPLMTIIMAFAMMIGSGGSAFVSIKLGERNEKKAEKTLSNVFILSLVTGIIIMALGLLFLEPLLKLFGTTENIMPYAKDYAGIILIGTPFSMLGISLSNLARSDGQPRLSMYSVLIGAVLNTILDPLYIFVFHWGVKGAAIATVTSQILTAVVLMVYFAKYGNMKFRRKEMIPDLGIYKSVLSLGISSGITQLVACVMQVTMNNSLVYYGDLTEVGGDTALSAMGIVVKVAIIFAAVCMGFGVGAQPILGFNYGARNPHRIKDTYGKAVKYATLCSVIGWIICQVFPEQILRVFGGGNPTFMGFAVLCMRTYLKCLFCLGFQIVSTSYFQATGQPLKASVLSMLRQLLLLIPLILILPLFFGLNGVLYAAPVADIGSALIVFAFIFYEMKKLNRWIRESDNKIETKVATENLG